VFERFTERARHVMVMAQDESRLLDHDHIGTEHILLGVVREGEGPAATLLVRHGLTLDALRAHLQPGTTFTGGSVPFTPGAKRALERALQEALALNHPDIEPEHLLLALTDEIPEDPPTAGAASLLQAAGIHHSVLHVELLSVLPKGPARRRRRLPGLPGRVPPLGPVRATQGAPIGRMVPGAGPVCPTCSTPLADNMRVAALSAEVEEGAETTDAVPVSVVYCGSCGTALSALAP
jgi:hypothetical protein